MWRMRGISIEADQLRRMHKTYLNLIEYLLPLNSMINTINGIYEI